MPTQAAEALATLALAVNEPELRGRVVAALEALARDDRYSEAQAGRFGLRVLHDVGAVDTADILVARFASDDRPDEPGPGWVAEHLETAQRLQWVRAAALRGHRRALRALIAADVPARDDEIREACVRATRSFLASDIGMTPDESGIWGLLALDLNGMIAAATADDELRSAAAERLLVYAAEWLLVYAADSRWPMYNRVSAVRGIYALAKDGGESNWLDDLRPLATPHQDLDQQSPPHLREMWAEPGDLEAVALTVCALLSMADPPGWLSEAVSDARFDGRVPLRVAAWNTVSERGGGFERPSARHALHDQSARVRIAALHAWRRHGGPLPRAELRRLATDESAGTRLALVRLLEELPDREVADVLLRDPDAYVRGVARRQLRGR